jgi:hypothetical protein
LPDKQVLLEARRLVVLAPQLRGVVRVSHSRAALAVAALTHLRLQAQVVHSRVLVSSTRLQVV